MCACTLRVPFLFTHIFTLTLYTLHTHTYLHTQVPQDGRYWCEGDGCFVDTPEQRYMMSVRVADATGELYTSMFNKEVSNKQGVGRQDTGGG